MEGNMENKRTGIDLGNIKLVLEGEIMKWEEGSNTRFILEQISRYFNEAVNSVNDKENLSVALKKLKIYESNLGEKYRDTAEEKQYIETVNQAIEHFSNL